MTDQGRFLKVMFALMGAMTFGALILLGLEGKPIKPMAFSLSSPAQLNSARTALGTESGIDPKRWRSIEIDYRSDNGQLSHEHGPAGRLAMGYHFVISDGNSGNDGEIYATHRWTKQQACLDDQDRDAPEGAIRICLMNQDNVRRSTPQQARQLESLVLSLIRNCDSELKVVWKNRS